VCRYLVLADDDSLDRLHDVDAAGAPLGPDDPVCGGEVHVPAIVLHISTYLGTGTYTIGTSFPDSSI